MTKTSAITTIPEQAQDASSLNGLPVVTDAESCAGTDVNESDIAALAYRLWVARGCPEGCPEVDWFLAQHLLDQSQRSDLS